MRTIQCDACGNEAVPHYSLAIVNDDGYGIGDYDLCEACAITIRDAIKAKVNLRMFGGA